MGARGRIETEGGDVPCYGVERHRLDGILDEPDRTVAEADVGPAGVKAADGRDPLLVVATEIRPALDRHVQRIIGGDHRVGRDARVPPARRLTVTDLWYSPVRRLCE